MKKSVKIILFIIVVLVAIRLILPYWVTNYVNKVLDQVPGYTGSISDVELHLYRGAYTIHQLKMEKTGEDIPVPFLDIKSIDLSVEWSAIFKGKLVGEVELQQPVINFVLAVADSSQAEQSGGEADWTKPLKDLIPLQINKFEVSDGTISFRDYTADPKVNIALEQLQLTATNLSNVEREDVDLPSNIDATATSIGGGTLSLNAKANLLKKIPDFDMNATFENVSLPALNNFTKAYAKLDFEEGVFNIYSEMAVSEGMLTGYVKPVITQIKVVDLSEDKKKPLQLLWESVAGTVMELFENQRKDQFATRVPLEGDLNKVKTSIWPTLGNILKNAFLHAFEMKTDSSVSFEELKEK